MAAEVAVPLLWNTAAALAIMPTADVLTQHVEISYSKPEEPQEFSYRRVGRMTVFAIISTPVWFFWYRFLAKAFPGRDIGTVVLAVFVDKFIFSPPLYAAGLSLNAWMANENAWEVLKEDFIPTSVVAISFWFPVKVVIFYFVESPYWLVTMRACDIVFLPLLSHLLNRNINDEIANEKNGDAATPPPDGEPQKRKKKVTFSSPRCCNACNIQ